MISIRSFLQAMLAILFVVCAAGEILAAEPPDDAKRAAFLVYKIISAYGGRDVIEGAVSVYAKGTTDAVMRNDHGTYERYIKRDRKLMVKTTYQRSSEHRILNGKRGYRGTATDPLAEVTDFRYLAMLYQYKYLDLPYGLLKEAYTISYKGRDKVDGADVEVLVLNDNEGPPMQISIDTNTFLIVKVTGYFTVGANSTDLTAVFSDFRSIHGMTFPFKMVNYGGGQRIADTIMTEYSINPEIDKKIFEPSPEK